MRYDWKFGMRNSPFMCSHSTLYVAEAGSVKSNHGKRDAASANFWGMEVFPLLQTRRK